ncbi:hypothetical protein R5R35_013961 [Gryllus longicercus]|uniref:R3H domain-containing protein n=1 Tax=Gryllus longicercus TaxID=2509291 RepID=A0AAN9YXJ2_9ORTH|nr:Uncharacterized protein GBIM_18538 [Gryllus bimaculatus]
MGVIKKNVPKLGVFTSDSEESLHIVQSSEDEDVSSISDIIVPVSSNSRVRRRVLPIPVSASCGRKNLGKKRFRRYENGHHLETLIEDEELRPVTIYDFIPNKCAGFSTVLESGEAKEKWENFLASSEDKQEQIIGQRTAAKCAQYALPLTPDEAFKNIKTGLRNILKKSQIPLGMIEYLENKLVEFFTNTPTDIFISEHLSSFERLLLHGVAQYYCLRSLSFNSDHDNVRLVRVSNPLKDKFHQPSMLLVQFLAERKNRSLSHDL